MSARVSHLVGPLLRHAREREVTLDLGCYGLSDDALSRDESAIDDEALGRLFDDLAVALHEPNLGLVLPGRLQFQRYVIPELVARASPNLRQSLQQWVQYSGLVHPAVAFSLEESDGVARFSHRTLGHPRGLSRHLNEFALAAAVHFGRETSGLGPRVLAVQFVHARPRALDPLRAFFQTDQLHFGAIANTLVIDSTSLDRAQHTADARMLATLSPLAQTALAECAPDVESVSSRVVLRLRAQLGRGELGIRALARELHMSVRTLQRRLGEEDTSFATLVDRVRHELSHELVCSADLTLAEVAHKLGFAEFATFSRAFKRWTGVAPGVYRTQVSMERAQPTRAQYRTQT